MKYIGTENQAEAASAGGTSDGGTANTSTDSSNGQLEGTITLWGEEIIINKRMVKIAEFTLKKQKVRSSKTLKVDTMSEKLTIKHPGRANEEII
jgi:stress response protein YsnF